MFYKHFLEQYLSLRESEAVDEYEEMLTHIRSNLHKCNKECMESHSYDEYINVATAVDNDCEAV